MRLTKTFRAIEILKYLPEPTTNDIINISKDLECSERLVWRALAILRKKNVKYYSKPMKLLLFLYELMVRKYSRFEPLTVEENRTLHAIEEYLPKEFIDKLKLR